MSIFTTFTGLEPLVLRFALASAGCVAAGLGVWAVTTLCRRWLPAIAAQRSVWLLGQCTVIAAFVLILLPQSERLRVLPPIDIENYATPAPAAPVADSALSPTAAVVNAPAAVTPQTMLAYAAQGWLLLYALGLCHTLIQLLHTRQTLNALACAGNRTNATPVHTIEIDAPISPMLFGLLRPRLLLPLHLRGFDADQRQMIVEHELTHWRRHDLQWASAGIVLQTLLWFNPFMRLLRNQLSWAQELGCDREVLQGRPPAQRKAYAAALIAQLKLQQAPISTALAFGHATPDTLADRIALIRTPAKALHGPWPRIATLAALAAVLATSLALQPSLASQSPKLFSCIALTDAATGQQLRRDGQCGERATPASTFNIVVALMGYDSGILTDEYTPVIKYQPSYTTWDHADWRIDTDPSSWIKYSNLWYAQQVVTQMGEEKLQRYVKRFGYGNQDVSGDAGKHNGLTQSWVESSLAISPDEQVAFLRKIVNRQLPISDKAYAMTARILHPQTLANGWTIYGKTGTGSPVLASGSDDDKRQYGWYVGWATKGSRTIVFANLALERPQEVFAGPRIRDAFLRNVATQLDTL